MDNQQEISSGGRFAFGRNWAKYLKKISEKEIYDARASISEWLGEDSLNGMKFIDVGSGSGVFSLAAKQLGAYVHSFDYDPESVECTKSLKEAYFQNDSNWSIESGSVLDRTYLSRLGMYDIVYSWGVLHHTGAMYEALSNVVQLVSPGGRLFIAIYNDQGWISRYWSFIKRVYNKNQILRFLMIAVHFPYLIAGRYLLRAVQRRPNSERGMTLWYDMLDWLGGYPFEVAKPEDILDFYRPKGFVLEHFRTCGGRHGCNEFIFRRA